MKIELIKNKIQSGILELWQDKFAQTLFFIFSLVFGLIKSLAEFVYDKDEVNIDILQSGIYAIFCYMLLNLVYFILTHNYKLNLAKKIIEKYFSWIIAILCFGLFIFNFWLFYPGYVEIDWAIIMSGFFLDNHHPIIYPWLLKRITDLFGYHTYYPLLFNLVPFYLGIYFLVFGLWKKFQSKLCLLGILPIFIGNIFFNNIFLHSSLSSPMFVFLLWAVVLYQILGGITYKNSAILFISFIFAVLSRHNAIIQVYPVFFVYSWFIVQKLKSSFRFIKYIGLLIFGAVFTLVLAIGVPRLLKKGEAYPSNHIFLHQIAGACVPYHDTSCFKSDWYKEGKNYQDVESQYLKHPLFADSISASWVHESPLKHEKIDNLSFMWLRAIMKHPDAYIKHVMRYIVKMWQQQPFQWTVALNKIDHGLEARATNLLIDKYPSTEIYYKSSDLKVKIYNFLKKCLPIIPTLHFILLNYIIFVISSILFYKKRDALSLYTLSSSIAGIAASIIFCIFSPLAVTRYIYPVSINSLISAIGLVLSFCVCKISFSNDILKAFSNHKRAASVIGFMILLCSFGIHKYGPLTARIDIYSPYTEEQSFIVYEEKYKLPLAEVNWMSKLGVRGIIAQKYGNSMSFTIMALQDSDITITLRGPDFRDKNNQILENWVKYTSFKINGQSVLTKHQDVWHNKPFKHVLKAKKNNTYTVELKWRKK